MSVICLSDCLIVYVPVSLHANTFAPNNNLFLFLRFPIFELRGKEKVFAREKEEFGENRKAKVDWREKEKVKAVEMSDN